VNRTTDHRASNDAQERAARIDMILEELRLNLQDMRELANQATTRSRQTATDTRVIRERTLEPRRRLKRSKR